MLLGEHGYGDDTARIRNAFDMVQVGDHFQVLVPTLVLIEGDDDPQALFEMSVVPEPKKRNGVRLLAECVDRNEESCTQRWLINDDGTPNTTPFVPAEGLQLGSKHLPSVLMHNVGWVCMMAIPPEIYIEQTEREDVGVVQLIA